MDETPIADLVAYTITPLSGALPQEGWLRIRSQGTCNDRPGPEIRNRAFPDFRALSWTPGQKEWSLVGYDIDASGKTTNIKVVSGTQNSDLDDAAKQAIADSRFHGGPREGCQYPYWLSPATITAPAAPEEADFRPANATCPADRRWAVEPNQRYSEPYRRRAIEGWAMLTFDVAPWGEVGNIQVAASEPTDEFGTQAVAIIRDAKVATTQGFFGCVERVRFTMGSEEN